MFYILMLIGPVGRGGRKMYGPYNDENVAATDLLMKGWEFARSDPLSNHHQAQIELSPGHFIDANACVIPIAEFGFLPTGELPMGVK